MESVYAWNRVYRFVMDLKKEYISTHPEDKDIYAYDGFESVIHKWANDNPVAQDITRFLLVNQYEDLCLLKYKNYTAIFGQIEYEDFWEVHEQFFRYCRGVTIDVKKETLVLCAFDKFFNINELPETSAENVAKRVSEASLVEITNKMDGSLQMARYYDGNIVLSGSTSLDPNESYRVANGINFISDHPEYIRMLMDNPDICFIFESIMPDDPHVVFYDYDKVKGLYLIGARDIRTGRVLDYSELSEFIKKYSPMHTQQELISFDEMLNMRKDYKCDEKEGWVVNIDGWRVKVKCDDFLTFHGILSGIRKNSDRLGNSILEAIKADRIDDFISSILPGRYHEEAMATMKTITDYLEYCEKNTDNYYNIGIQQFPEAKDFMTWVDQNVPKLFQGSVRNKFRGKETDFLKGKKFKNILEVMNNAKA